MLPSTDERAILYAVVPRCRARYTRDAAGSEFSAALLAYKRRELMETLASTPAEGASDDTTGDEANQNVDVVDSVASTPSPGSSGQATPFRASGALIFPGLDRGRTLWEEDHFQSSSVLKTVPVPLGGFFTNGVAGESDSGAEHDLVKTSRIGLLHRGGHPFNVFFLTGSDTRRDETLNPWARMTIFIACDASLPQSFITTPLAALHVACTLG